MSKLLKIWLFSMLTWCLAASVFAHVPARTFQPEAESSPQHSRPEKNDALGQRTQLTHPRGTINYPNGVHATTVYDGNGRIINYSHTQSGTAFIDHGILRDADGTKVQEEIRAGPIPITPSIDRLQRFTAANRFSNTHYNLPVNHCTWGPGGLLAYQSSNGLRYCHSDEQGSIAALTDTNGAVTDTFAWLPYGKLAVHTGTTDIPYGWLGSHGVTREPNDLYFMNARFYHAAMRRFLSIDPLGLQGGVNLYLYGNANPMSFIDPLGLCSMQNMASAFMPTYDISAQFGSYGGNTIEYDQNSTKDLFQSMAMVGGMAGAIGLAGGAVAYGGSAIVYASSTIAASAAGHGGVFMGIHQAMPAVGTVGRVLTSAFGATQIGKVVSSAVVPKNSGVKYVGKMDDLQGVPRSQTLLDDLPNMGSPKANYYQNSSVLRKAVRDGYQIRDASAYRPNWSPDPTRLRPTRTVGQSFLGAERNIMSNKGFLPDSSGTYIPR